MVIRYFLFAAAIGILSIPFAEEKFQPLQNLSAWHFVALIWGLGILGFFFKLLVDRPDE